MSLTGPTVRVKTPKPPRQPSEEDVAYVFARDGGCIVKQLVPSHVCSGGLTIEHVKDSPRMGKRAPSDRRHMVLACWQANVWTVETSKYRPLIREYLAMVEDAYERARKDWEEDANAVFNREPVEPLDEA
jgi:hypothetical protein